MHVEMVNKFLNGLAYRSQRFWIGQLLSKDCFPWGESASFIRNLSWIIDLCGNVAFSLIDASAIEPSSIGVIHRLMTRWGWKRKHPYTQSAVSLTDLVR